MNAATTKPRKMTPGMSELLQHFAAGAQVEPMNRSIKVGTKYHQFTNGSFVGLIDRKYLVMTTAIDEDECERRVWVISEAGKAAAKPMPVTEPQTAAYQAAVDNVWFENSQNAREIRAGWVNASGTSRWDFWNYKMDLEHEIETALGRYHFNRR